MKTETIVITGSIGSGKSSVVKAIGELSPIKLDFFNFDDYTKELYQRHDVQEFLMVMFGTTDKSKISNIVYKSEEMYENLNKAFFAFVESKFIELITRKEHGVLVIEFPMYFEMLQKSVCMQLQRSQAKVIVVTCDDEVRLDRVRNRDGSNSQKVAAILNHQMSQEDKKLKADYQIDTTDTATVNARLETLMRERFKKVFYHVVN